MASYVKSMLIKLKVEKAELSNRQWAAEKCGNIEAHDHCFDHTPFGGIVIPTLRRAISRTPKGAVLSGPTGVLLQMSDIKLTPNAPKE
jgi:hypothetical protein